MSKSNPRRAFLAHCGTLAGLVALKSGQTSANQDTTVRFQRSRLVNHDRAPLTVSDLVAQREYLFHYPYVTTPCFLLNLGRPAKQGKDLSTEEGKTYRASNGLGPERSVVAFSAICAHRMSHPTRAVSFIGYRETDTGFYDNQRNYVRQSGVIQCCSEQSVYDPSDGARVLGGPAPQPLASIVLEEDDRGHLHAVGVRGGMMFDRYFDTFGKRLVIEYERLDIDAPSGETAEVVELDIYTGKKINCG